MRSRPELIPLLTPTLTKYVPSQPHPKQQAFLWLPHREALFGGAAGGGKSEALLMAALQYVDVPGYAAILFRRTYTDLALPRALMDRAQQWLHGTDAGWDERDKTWRFPNGASLTFGYLDHEQAKFRYQSAEFQFVGFDELTQFSESQYLFLFSRLRRREGQTIPLRMRAASNPGGMGHEWVKARFIDGRSPDRVFIPARLEDNPSIDQAEYEESLAKLDLVTRRQFRFGDWDIRPSGNVFKAHWFEIIPAAPAEAEWVRYWDLAATEAKHTDDPDYTVGVLMGRTPQGVFVVQDLQRVRATPAAVEAIVKQQAWLDDPDIAIRMEQEPGSSGKATIWHYATMLAGHDFRGIPSTGSKELRAAPLSAQAEAGNVKLVAGPWNREFISELCAFPEAGHDDQVDAASGAFAQLAQPRARLTAKPRGL